MKWINEKIFSCMRCIDVRKISSKHWICWNQRQWGDTSDWNNERKWVCSEQRVTVIPVSEPVPSKRCSTIVTICKYHHKLSQCFNKNSLNFPDFDSFCFKIVVFIFNVEVYLFYPFFLGLWVSDIAFTMSSVTAEKSDLINANNSVESGEAMMMSCDNDPSVGILTPTPSSPLIGQSIIIWENTELWLVRFSDTWHHNQHPVVWTVNVKKADTN